MDIEQKKGEVKGDIARGPENVVFSRIDICDEIQLADLMKEQFTPYLDNLQGLHLVELLGMQQILYMRFASILQNNGHFFKVRP